MAGLTYDGIPSTREDSSTFSGTTLFVDTISGATAYRGATVITTTSISGVNLNLTGSALESSGRRLRSDGIGSPVSYGAFVQAGSIATSAGSNAFIKFGTQFSTNAYYIVATPGSYNSGVGSGGVVPYLSGVQNVSGVLLVGAPSLVYNWIAVGN